MEPSLERIKIQNEDVFEYIDRIEKAMKREEKRGNSTVVPVIAGASGGYVGLNDSKAKEAGVTKY